MKDFTISAVAQDWTMADSSGHGSFTASIVNALAPQCELLIGKVLTHKNGSWSTVIRGIEWAVESGEV